MSKKGLNGKVTIQANQNVNISSKDIADLTHAMKEFMKVLPNVSSAINKVDKTTNKNKIDTFNSATNSISKYVRTLSRSPSLDADRLTSIFDTLDNSIERMVNSLSSISDVMTSGGLDVTMKSARAMDKVFDSFTDLSNMTDARFTKGMSRANTVFEMFSDNLSETGTRLKGMEDTFNKSTKLLDSMLNTVTSLSSIDGRKLNGVLNKLKKWYDVINDKQIEGSIAKMEKEYEKWVEIRTRKEAHLFEWNEKQREASRQYNMSWLSELRGKGIKTSLFGDGSEGSGKLGKEIKSSLIGGLKGAIIGAIIGAITSALNIVKKLFFAPLEIVKKLATGILGLLKKGLTSAQTFTKLLDLVVLPFTLLFTLLFAPILMKLAPLLVDVVNQVMSKWDVLEGIGDKIAEVLSYLFNEENWFAFGNMVDVLIDLLNDLADVAYNTFKIAIDNGRSGLDVLVDVASNMIIALTEHILNFLQSPEGKNLFFNIGRLFGTVLVEGLKVGFYVLIDLIISFSGTIVGMLQSLIGVAIGTLGDIATSFVRSIFANIGRAFISALGHGEIFDNYDNSNWLQLDTLKQSNIGTLLRDAQRDIMNYDTTTVTNNYYQNINGLYSSFGDKNLTIGGFN